MTAAAVETHIAIGCASEAFADYSALLALIQSAFAAHAGRIDPPSSATRARAESLRAMAQDGVLLLATTEEGRPVGCVFGTPEGDALYLGKLAVDPTWQGRGIGRRLVEALAAYAVDAGYARITLGVRLALTENIALFESLGFVRTEVRCHPGFTSPTSQNMALELARRTG